MSSCSWCECDPCWLDCAERHRPRRVRWGLVDLVAMPVEDAQALRASALGLLGDGLRVVDVAEVLGLLPDTVSQWRRRARARTMKAAGINP